MDAYEGLKIGDWVILKGSYIDSVKKGYDKHIDEFDRRYKYAQKIVKIKRVGYPVYGLSPSGNTFVKTALYRLATEKEIKTAKLKGMFKKEVPLDSI
jgi:hypothetical protein